MRDTGGLPADLAERLRRARDLEMLAETAEQQYAARELLPNTRTGTWRRYARGGPDLLAGADTKAPRRALADSRFGRSRSVVSATMNHYIVSKAGGQLAAEHGDPLVGKMVRINRLGTIFTPRAPVASKDRFAGRLDQVIEISQALLQPGSHVVLYGERGVGKTSLANVLYDFIEPVWPDSRVVRINCTTSDTFASVWRKVFAELRIPDVPRLAYAVPDPDDIRASLAEHAPHSVIILDEYDRMEDSEGLSLMADTVKALSDHEVPSKLVLVGVADSIDQLVGEHASVQRAFVEVAMPRMSQDELVAIIDNGLTAANMTISVQARARIGRLAEGLPHYVHLLSLSSAQTALKDDRDNIGVEDVKKAIEAATRTHSLVREYQNAIQSPRRENLFPQVLTACALAEKNRLGYFTAAAVRAPMSKIMGRPYDIPAFARHLSLFIEHDRGPVLRREGTERRYTYRFINPLLQPFAILTAVADGLIDDSILAG